MPFIAQLAIILGKASEPIVHFLESFISIPFFGLGIAVVPFVATPI